MHFATMGNYKKLKVWEKAHAVALEVCRTAAGIPSGQYGCLRNQMIRAALSIPTNIVEGSGQESGKDCCRFLRYSINSANEAEYHCLVARDLGLIGRSEHGKIESNTIEVRRMLYGLQRRIRASRTDKSG